MGRTTNSKTRVESFLKRRSIQISILRDWLEEADFPAIYEEPAPVEIRKSLREPLFSNMKKPALATVDTDEYPEKVQIAMIDSIVRESLFSNTKKPALATVDTDEYPEKVHIAVIDSIVSSCSSVFDSIIPSLDIAFGGA